MYKTYPNLVFKLIIKVNYTFVNNYTYKLNTLIRNTFINFLSSYYGELLIIFTISLLLIICTIYKTL